MPATQARQYHLLGLSAAIVAITALHYGTSIHHTHLHEVFRRLYYLPIILSAFWFGWRGGVGSATVVSLLYLPHVMLQWGGEYLLNLMEVALYNVVGGVTGMMVSAERRQRDLYEQASLEIQAAYQRLQVQTEQLRVAERLSVLGELAAGMAHEIKNPLGSIKGTAEILVGDALSDEERTEFGRILIKEVDRLDGVLHNYLRVARSPGASQVSVDLAEIVRSTVTLVGACARRQSVMIQEELEEGIKVLADEGQMTQAILNVILNAVAASEKGGSITVTAGRVAGHPSGEREGKSEKWVEVKVADTGCGIPREHLGQVFTPLFTTRSDGTGLGLPITRRIVEAHGGSIRIASQPGEGTTVSIALPLAHPVALPDRAV